MPGPTDSDTSAGIDTYKNGSIGAQIGLANENQDLISMARKLPYFLVCHEVLGISVLFGAWSVFYALDPFITKKIGTPGAFLEKAKAELQKKKYLTMSQQIERSQATFARWHRGVSPRLPSSFKGNTSRLASSFVYSTIFRKTPPISILLVSGKITLAALLTLQLSSEGADEGKGS